MVANIKTTICQPLQLRSNKWVKDLKINGVRKSEIRKNHYYSWGEDHLRKNSWGEDHLKKNSWGRGQVQQA